MPFVHENGLPAAVAGSFVSLELVAFVGFMINKRFAIRAQGRFAAGLFARVASSAAAACWGCRWLILLVIVVCFPTSASCNERIHLLEHRVHGGFIGYGQCGHFVACCSWSIEKSSA